MASPNLLTLLTINFNIKTGEFNVVVPPELIKLYYSNPKNFKLNINYSSLEEIKNSICCELEKGDLYSRKKLNSSKKTHKTTKPTPKQISVFSDVDTCCVECGVILTSSEHSVVINGEVFCSYCFQSLANTN